VSDQIDEIQKWLRKKGYPLEMQVAKAFGDVGLRVQQGHYYQDLETGEQREIDVLAREFSIFRIAPRLINIAVDVVVECKGHPPDRPFLVFSTAKPDQGSGWRRLMCAGSRLGKGLVDYLELDTDSLPLFKADEEWIGYGMAQAKLGKKDGDNRDGAFGALMQASKASCALLGAPHLCTLSFPVVVVNGPLFDCHLDEQGETVVTEVEEHVIEWAYPLPHGPAFHTVRVVTQRRLATFANEAARSAKALVEAYKVLPESLYLNAIERHEAELQVQRIQESNHDEKF
tara:strand:- start:128 stop:985 length:858 start_codon:yes stop_codon:yes gene_type:complete